MTENIEVFINNSIRIRDRIGTIYIDPYEMKEEPHDADYIFITQRLTYLLMQIRSLTYGTVKNQCS